VLAATSSPRHPDDQKANYNQLVHDKYLILFNSWYFIYYIFITFSWRRKRDVAAASEREWSKFNIVTNKQKR
jgi:hypothetical protein